MDPSKIRDKLNQKTKKKVELISPQPKKDKDNKEPSSKEDSNNKPKDKTNANDKKPKEKEVWLLSSCHSIYNFSSEFIIMIISK